VADYGKPKEEFLNLSRDLIKIAIENNELNNYNNYLKLQKSNLPCGQFTLLQLAQITNHKSLKNKSNFNRWKSVTYKQLIGSEFVCHVKGDTFQIISWKKILVKHKGNAKTSFYRVPLCAISTRQAFKDRCIGLFIGREKSNKTAANAFKCSERRVQFATSRNNKVSLITKQARRKIEVFKTQVEAQKAMEKCNDIGVNTSNVFKYKLEYGISVGHTNSYQILISRRYKGIKARKRAEDSKTCARSENWTRPAFTGASQKYAKQYFEKKHKCKFVEFNHKYYTLDDFAHTYSEVYA
jgi:hypothetical protein